MRSEFPIRSGLLLASLAGLCAWLGAWQWERMHWKQDLIAQFEAAPQREYPSAVDGKDTYARVSLAGTYLHDWHLLHDNRIENGRSGVHVLSLFQPDHGPALLVNRGWLPLAPDRRELPEVVTPEGRTVISGLLAAALEPGVRLGDPDNFEQLAGTTLMTYLDLDRLAAAVDAPLPSFVLLLDPTEPSGYGTRAWTAAVMLPAQHRAYSVQWFALSAAALIIWLCLVLRWRAVRNGART